MSSKNNSSLLGDSLHTLDTLLKKRSGGAVNIRGIHYQVLYACHIILEKLDKTDTEISITLEGIEDIDIHMPISLGIVNSYLQLKSSENKLNASDFWTMGVLQNFLPVYLADPTSSFQLVYNFHIAEGSLKELFEKKLKAKSSAYWSEKLGSLNCPNINITEFLKSISYHRYTTDELLQSIVRSLYKHWEVGKGSESQFVNALFYKVLVWSKERRSVHYQDVLKLFMDIKDSYSKVVSNPSITHNWIEAVNYNAAAPSDLMSYYEGKAARPYHIAAQLPAHRKVWEKKISDTLKEFDVTVIRSSSGQGKSTLAWQAGYQFKDQYKIYQLHIARTWEEVNSLMEFLETRVAIGETPLIIIDGLNMYIENWAMLIERTASLPVRYLITTRHEDWNRYGADISKISLQHIDINISSEEAKDIFSQFKSKGKLHPETKDWQPIWEQVYERGLLIEYTFLLTRGEMIRDRLAAQIKTLNANRESASKIEILRILSLADSLGIRVRTRTLLDYIANSVGFGQDRGEMLASLENEYFLNFENKYIEGLHPIRSNHLKELLHRTLPISDSLIHLYTLLEPDDIEVFFSTAPLLVIEDRTEFYSAIAEILKDRSFMEMVNALHGVAHAEPQKYWKENQEIFDNAFETGGIDLFVMHTIPGSTIDTFKNLMDILPEGLTGNLKYLSRKLEELPVYSFEKSDVASFAEELLKVLGKRTAAITSYQGLDLLAKWYRKLHLNINFLIPLIEKDLIHNLCNMPLPEARGLFQYFHIAYPDRFKKFVTSNKEVIINYLRKNSNSLIIKEKGKNITIEYFIDLNEETSTNELSVNRIENVFAFLPYYERYNTQAIMLPFPTEEVIKVVKNDARKNMSPENIIDHYESRYNRIWMDTIQKNYQESSAYQWQKKMFDIRQIALEWCRCFVRIIDGKLEGNAAKADLAVRTFLPIQDKLRKAMSPNRPYPTYSYKLPPKKDRDKAEKTVGKWIASLTNSNNQLTNLFSPKGDNDRNLAAINTKAIYYELHVMQLAFHEMEEKTIAYFDAEVHQLDAEEKLWYGRLLQTILYFMEHLPIENQVPVRVARKTIQEWYQGYESTRMNLLKEILEGASQQLVVNFRLPVAFIETQTLTTVTIAIEDYDFAADNALLLLAEALISLADFPATFFIVLNLRNNTIIGALRFTRDFFKAYQDYIRTGIEGDLLKLMPLPLLPDNEVKIAFPDIEVPEHKIDSIGEIKVKLVVEVWKYFEAKSRLDRGTTFEKAWLTKLEEHCRAAVKKELKAPGIQDSLFLKWINDVLNGSIQINVAGYINKLIDIGQESGKLNI
jgi:hypothetical protein